MGGMQKKRKGLSSIESLHLIIRYLNNSQTTIIQDFPHITYFQFDLLLDFVYSQLFAHYGRVAPFFSLFLGTFPVFVLQFSLKVF